MQQLIYPFTVIVFGFLLSRLLPRIGCRSLAAACLFVFLPCLFFKQSIGQNVATPEFSYILFFTFFHTVSMFLIAKTIFSVIRFPEETVAMAVLNVLLPSMFGLFVIQGSFSSNNVQSLQLINILIFYQFILMATVGIYLAGYTKPWWMQLIHTIQTPLPYVIVLGLILSIFEFKRPNQLIEIVDNLYLVSNPLALLVIGIGIGNCIFLFDTKSYTAFFPGVFLCAFLRLIVSPIVAWFIVWMMGIQEGGSPRAVILAAGLPTGMYAGVMAGFYGKDDRIRFTLLCILVTTILSFITVPAVTMLLEYRYALE